jgi:hypothetical protein
VQPDGDKSCALLALVFIFVRSFSLLLTVSALCNWDKTSVRQRHAGQ